MVIIRMGNGDSKNIFDYLTLEELNDVKEFAKDKKTPFLVVDLRKIADKFDELARLMPYAKIYYAVKANSMPEVLELLASKGSCFDVATIFELEQVLKLGVTPDRISFGNTIKKEEDVKYAYEKGIRLFVSDSITDLKKISNNAPGSNVFFRIINEGGEADWPLSRKFGAHPDMIYHLIIEAKNLGLIPYGISFHVGSQQRDVGQWDNAVSQCRYLFDSVKADGIDLKAINIGGGFPAHYLKSAPSIDTYTKEITRILKDDFGDNFPTIIVEPGRSIVADSGVLVTEVIMISKKSIINQYEWVYIDCGIYNGLFDTINESIKYPIFSERILSSKDSKEIILAGPTCDSLDVLYEDYKYTLPTGLKEGDRLYVLTAGAYVPTLSSVGFNGFPPLKIYILK